MSIEISGSVAGLTATYVDEDFSTWINKPYISEDLRKKLSGAIALIIPEEGFRDFEKPVFPVKTEEIFTFLRNNFQQVGEIDICIEEGDYLELALHSHCHRLGKFLVKSVALPVLLGLLTNYVYDKLDCTSIQDDVRVSIVVVDDKARHKAFTFEGKAKDFGPACEEINKMWDK